MKYATLLLILFSLSMYGQSITCDQLKSATERPKGNFREYTAKNGEIFRIGEKIKIGQPSNGLFFNYVYEGDGLTKTIGKAGTTAAGVEVEIKAITIDGSKTKGFIASVRTKGGFGGYGIFLENAIESGEVVTSVMTSDKALAELKKAKDKLDLGLITLEEYEKIKSELAKYIH